MAEKSKKRYKLSKLKAKPKHGPIKREEDILPDEIIEFIYSFGYQCVGSPNICMVDPKTAVFGAGSAIVIYDIEKKIPSYVPTITGGGIGYIAVHPTDALFAVAEKGEKPKIVVFNFPELEPVKLLRGGAKRAYAFLEFSPEGELLASVGGPPDYFLTIWNWENEGILLRYKAFSQSVWNSAFSRFLHGQLTTSGLGHIRFWKMAYSFTGLKLQGEIGRFGQLEISDIYTSIHLPDGKVISGSQYGYMLIWDGGRVHAQLRKSDGKPCHAGNIYQLILLEAELITVGDDGFIRIWDLESIEGLEPEEEAGFLPIDPVNELLVQKNAKLYCMVPAKEDHIWCIQNLQGSIWKVDLSFSIGARSPEIIFSAPGIKITGCAMCPIYPLCAVSALDCTIHIFECISKKALVICTYKVGVSSLQWASTKVDSLGGSLFAGFQDGVVRWLVLSTNTLKSGYDLILKHACKPHTVPVTHLKINGAGTMLATGALDNSVFFFNINEDELVPIGFIVIQEKIQWMTWFKHEKETLLTCFGGSTLVQYDTPTLKNLKIKKRTTFCIENLPKRTYKLGNMRMERYRRYQTAKALREAEEAARLLAEEEARAAEEDARALEADDTVPSPEPTPPTKPAPPPEPAPPLPPEAAPAATAEADSTVAESAETAAEGAETTAEGVETAAEGAETTAEGVEITAEVAETAAEGTEAAAEGTETAAEGAETAAEDAETAAEGAETAAEGAETAAEDAETAAEETEAEISIESEEEDFEDQDFESDYQTVIHTFYESDKPGYMWLSLGNRDTGYLHECSFSPEDEAQSIDLIPDRIIKMADARGQAIVSFNISPCSQYLFTGQENGVLSVYFLEEPNDLSTIKEYWKFGFHDCVLGPIDYICLSSDCKCIVTSGRDNNILFYLFNAKEYCDLILPTETPKFPYELMPDIMDITEDKFLSIEEEFQKERTKDALEQLEIKIERMKNSINILQGTLSECTSANEELPENCQIDLSKYAISANLNEKLQNKFSEHIELVKKKMAWNFEFQSLALRKMHNRIRTIRD